MNFHDLGIESSILRSLKEIGYEEPTPIQREAIPAVLSGRDLLGCAQTGTGKTAAFSLPMLQRMGKPEQGTERPVRGLILTPTRELALQIYENICQYSRYTGRIAAVIYGGVSQDTAGRSPVARCGYSCCHTGTLVGPNGSETARYQQSRVLCPGRG